MSVKISGSWWGSLTDAIKRLVGQYPPATKQNTGRSPVGHEYVPAPPTTRAARRAARMLGSRHPSLGSSERNPER